MRLVTAALLLGALPWALPASDADPFLGKWKLNWNQSRSSGAAPKSAVRKYSKSGGGVHVSEVWIGSDGRRMRVDYVASYDGREYPVPTSKGATIAFTKADQFTVQGSSKVDGKLNFTFKRIVSPDRKTLTIEMSKTDPTGQPLTEVLVYNRM